MDLATDVQGDDYPEELPVECDVREGPQLTPAVWQPPVDPALALLATQQPHRHKHEVAQAAAEALQRARASAGARQCPSVNVPQVHAAVPAPAPPQAVFVPSSAAVPLLRETMLRAAAEFGLVPVDPPAQIAAPHAVSTSTPAAVPGHLWEQPLRAGHVDLAGAGADPTDSDGEDAALLAAAQVMEARRPCVLPVTAVVPAATSMPAAAVPPGGAGPPTWVLQAMRSLDVAAIVFSHLDGGAKNAVMGLSPRWRDALLHSAVWQPRHWTNLSVTLGADATVAANVLWEATRLARLGLQHAQPGNAGALQPPRLTNCQVPFPTGARM